MARKGTLQGSKALTGGFGIQAGLVKVVDNRFKIIQYTKGDGGLVTPMLVHQLDVVKVDEKFTPVDENDVQQHDMLLCWGTKEKDENGLHRYRFHPGLAKSGTDDDVKDLGAEIGVEGNTFCMPEDVEGEAIPFADVDAVLFTKGLEKKGVKPEINNQAYAPNYNGIILDVETVNPDVLCKELGVRYNSPKDPGQKPKPQWKIKAVANLDAWMAGVMGGKPAKGKAPATPASKANGSAPAASEFDVPTYVLDRAKEVAVDAKGKELTKAEFKQAVYKKALKKSAPPKFHKAIQDYSTSDEGIMALAGEEVLVPIMDETNDEVIKAVSFA